MPHDPQHPAAEDRAGATLEDALEAAKGDLILEAIDGEDTHCLAAQAYAVEALERLVYGPHNKHRPEPPTARFGGIADAAVELAKAVKSSGLEAGHFVGMFGELLAPLEALHDELEREGLVA